MAGGQPSRRAALRSARLGDPAEQQEPARLPVDGDWARRPSSSAAGAGARAEPCLPPPSTVQLCLGLGRLPCISSRQKALAASGQQLLAPPARPPGASRLQTGRSAPLPRRPPAPAPSLSSFQQSGYSCCCSRHTALAAPLTAAAAASALPPLLPAGFGAAYGTAKSGVGIASMGVMRPELVMKSIVPVVMAGVLGIYGLIIAVIISTNSELSLSCGKARRVGGGRATATHVGSASVGPAREPPPCLPKLQLPPLQHTTNINNVTPSP